MPRITRVYTRTGDDGSTGLGGGQRVAKHSPRIEACGAVDELNAQLGAAIALGLDPDLEAALKTIQNELFHLGAELCVPAEDEARVPGPRIEQRHIDALERLLDRLNADVGPLENFILPGGSPGAAALHVARTVCRRAERRLSALAAQEAVGPLTLPYLNRLSDALFVMARFENRKKNVKDVCWNSRA
jgi:cob(I)alamin adenosyltransferase